MFIGNPASLFFQVTSFSLARVEMFLGISTSARRGLPSDTIVDPFQFLLDGFGRVTVAPITRSRRHGGLASTSRGNG